MSEDPVLYDAAAPPAGGLFMSDPSVAPTQEHLAAAAALHPPAVHTPHAADVNPCARCAGQRSVHQYSNRDPQFWVTCLGCQSMLGAETLDGVVAMWNAANPPREVTPEDVAAAMAATLQPKLTPAFLEVLAEVEDVYDASSQPMDDVAAFVIWCHTQAGQTPPLP